MKADLLNLETLMQQAFTVLNCFAHYFMSCICINRNKNIVEQMIYMLERHSSHLEELVHERTKQLTEEQKKTDELISRMLPKLDTIKCCLIK